MKYARKKERANIKATKRTLLAGVASMLICVALFMGTTFAWFTDSASTTVNQIKMAEFTASVTVNNAAQSTDSITLNSGKSTVTVTADGTATMGYCTIEFNNEAYHTIQLFTTGEEEKPKSVTFTVNASDGTTIKITPQWGTYANTDSEALIGDALNVLGTPQTENEAVGNDPCVVPTEKSSSAVEQSNSAVQNKAESTASAATPETTDTPTQAQSTASTEAVPETAASTASPEATEPSAEEAAE